MRRGIVGFWGILVLVAGCASGGAAGGGGGEVAPRAAAGAAVAAEREGPAASAVHWTRDAAEYQALLVQTYGWAGDQIRASSAGRAAGAWGVIMDADETVLDNSTYQKERLGETPSYTSASWAAWVRRRAAAAVPGAAGFIALVRGLGGRVAIVTNRDEVLCPDTRENLMALGIDVDAVLCRAPGESDKNPRFDRIVAGTALPGLPPLEVLMWVGDNIQDFPGMSQSARERGEAAWAEFGTRFIVLPNPMYGSWESNGWR